MGSIVLPALDVRVPQMESPLDKYAKVMQLKNIMQRAKLGDIELQKGGMELQKGGMELQEAEQQQRDMQIVMEAFKKNGGNYEKTIKDAAAAGASPFTLQKLKDQQTAQETQLATLDTAKLANLGKSYDVLRGHLDAIKLLPPEEQAPAYAQVLATLQQQGINTAVLPKTFNPEAVPFWEAMLTGGKEAADRAVGEATRKETERHNRAMETKGAAPGAPSDMEQRVQDRLAAKKLPDTPTNRNTAYLELLREEGAARREPKDVGDVEGEANDYADSLEKGTLQWSQVPIKMRGKVTGIINKRGTVVLNTKQREALQSSERAETIINAIDEASKKVHSGATVPGQKWVSGLAETGASIAFPSGNPDLDALQSGAAALGPIIRNLGEMGNLSEGDIARAVAAVPVSRFLTRKEAEARLSKLREFVAASRNAIQAVAGKTAKELFAPPPKGGQGMVTFQDSSGKQWTIPNERLDEARKRDPGLRVIQ